MGFKVLYVDTLSEAQAQPNVEGIFNAYKKIAKVIKLDYRWMARYLGKDLMNTFLYMISLIYPGLPIAV